MLTALSPGFSLVLRQCFTAEAPAVCELRILQTWPPEGGYRIPTSLAQTWALNHSFPPEQGRAVVYTIIKALR